MSTTSVRPIRVLLSPVALAVLLLGVIAGLLPLRTASADDASMAFVRVLHAAPYTGLGGEDVYLDGQMLLPNISFGSLSEYTPIAPGDHKIQFAPASAGILAVVSTAPVTLAARSYYTVATYSPHEGDFESTIFTDASGWPPTGQAHLTGIHLGADSGAIDIAVVNGPVLLMDLLFGLPSTGIDIPAGNYSLEVRKGGTSDVLFTLPSTDFQANMDYTLYGIGLLAGPPPFSIKIGALSPLPGWPNTAGGPPNQAPDTADVTSSVGYRLLFGTGALILLLVASLASYGFFKASRQQKRQQRHGGVL
ncbi:MAG TPA: DUF4397 domain-containing protein [Ktedonobacterales bacterium]|jgi:hypothetical protein